MNKVILMGRLTADPTITRTNSQSAVAKFHTAVNRMYQRDGEQQADFISCTAFGKTAEFIEKYITKGTKVVIEGRWQTGSYTDRSGNKVYTNDCIVETVEFAESKRTATQQPANATQTGQPEPLPDTNGFFDALPDEGLPF